METLTQEQREEGAEHDGTDDGPDAAALAAIAGDSSGEERQAAPPLPGFEDLIGGDAPTGAAVRLMGGSVSIDPPPGGFKKGTSYVVRVEARCDEIDFKDERDDETGQVVATIKLAKLKIRNASLA